MMLQIIHLPSEPEPMPTNDDFEADATNLKPSIADDATKDATNNTKTTKRAAAQKKIAKNAAKMQKRERDR